jgi:hypothetical protein
MFTKGNPGKPKGATNHLTQDMRTRIGIFVDKTWRDMVAIFKAMPDDEKADFYLRLLKYAVPELKAVDITTKGETIGMRPLEVRVLSAEDLENLNDAIKEIESGKK